MVSPTVGSDGGGGVKDCSFPWGAGGEEGEMRLGELERLDWKGRA